MDHASDVYIGGGFWFICLGNFCLLVLWEFVFIFCPFSEEPHNFSLFRE